MLHSDVLYIMLTSFKNFSVVSKSRATSEEMKERPYTRNFGEAFVFKCPTTCPFFGTRGKGAFYEYDSCLTALTLGEVKIFIEFVLGLRDSEASSSLERTRRLESYMWLHWKKEGFCFQVGERQVCETTIAFLLGYIDNEEGGVGSCGGGWKTAKKRVKDAKTKGIDLLLLQNEDVHLATTASG